MFSRLVEDWTDPERSGMCTVLQSSFDAWEHCINDAEHKGKGTFVKEHVNWVVGMQVESPYLHGGDDGEDAVSNPPCAPDSFLLDKARPTFLIRHPALAFPSLFRTALDNEGLDALLKDSADKTMRWEATYHWHTTLYRTLLASSSYPCPSRSPEIQYPIILDASDLSEPKLVRRYAAAVGLDSDLVRFEWDAASEQDRQGLSRTEARMKDTLLESTGVVVDKLQEGAPLDLETERRKWRHELGAALGERLTRLVQGAMRDYEWLWERRLRA